jgi:type III secretion protein V
MWGQLLPSGGRAEVMAATVVVAIVISMILPVPAWLLDVLIALNICISCLLVVLVMQLKTPTHLSAFPSLLLLTTLFRVSINVASTRQILLEASAGHIIEAFGEVVVGGNLVVGLVVFIILTLIQFLVITKGSERVAEVGARFTLDAMPGKQLAIDIELKAGTILPEEARLRRLRLGQESQFFGAMDGALKFVKGDAIAGIVITLTNLIGGLTIGVTQRGMSGADAAQLYSVLSIGDALVAQIPSLLMSLTAGLLITRVANGEDGPSDIGKEISSQLKAYPKAWVTASGAMLVFGLVPGMPTPIFLVLGLGSLLFGLNCIRQSMKKSADETPSVDPEMETLREFKTVYPFVMRFSSGIESDERAMQLLRLTRQVRNRLVNQYGLVTPAIESQSQCSFHDADAEFCHDEVRVLALALPCGQYLVEGEPTLFSALQTPPLRQEAHPRYPRWVRAWFPEDALSQLIAEGLNPISDWVHAEQCIEKVLLTLGPRHFGIEQATRLSKWVAENHPDVGKELERVVTTSRLAEVMQKLLSERVSIRNLVRIAEALVEWGQRERDPAVLTECIRSVLGREICNAYATQLQLQAILLDPDVEERIRGSIRQTAYGDYLTLDPADSEAFSDGLADLLIQVPAPLVPVILCAQDIRPQVRRLFQDRFNDVAVLSMVEVPSDFKVQVLGVLGRDALALGESSTPDEPEEWTTTPAGISE